jgi:Uma2 family endonuclease
MSLLFSCPILLKSWPPAHRAIMEINSNDSDKRLVYGSYCPREKVESKAMAIQHKHKLYTLDEFREIVSRPENSDKLFEFIDGEIIEVSPGRTSNSEIGHIISGVVRPFCQDHQIPCHTSGGDGAYLIGGRIVAPDFAYKPTPMSKEYPDPTPPTLVVEIISPTDEPAQIRKKREIYRQAGIMLWEMYPESHSVDVYPPGREKQTVGLDGELDGGDVLPGFKLPVRDIFPEE